MSSFPMPTGSRRPRVIFETTHRTVDCSGHVAHTGGIHTGTHRYGTRYGSSDPGQLHQHWSWQDACPP
ncbi:hypothetical protein PC128_g20906 [Phytophthora cactorum]|nr:hypothetical protein PC128_g20906 [Phytophthora cactorum]